jgi:hypothetical protein
VSSKATTLAFPGQGFLGVDSAFVPLERVLIGGLLLRFQEIAKASLSFVVWLVGAVPDLPVGFAFWPHSMQLPSSMGVFTDYEVSIHSFNYICLYAL